MKKLYLLLTLSFIFCCTTSFSVIRLVTNLSSSGPGSLNGEIIASGLGDTVLINVAGDLALPSTLNISKSDLTIIGPYPAYFNITGSGFTGSLIDISGSSNLKIENIGFKGSGASCRAVTSLGNTGLVYFENCLFENFSNIGSNGGAIFYSGDANSPFSLLSCSFINNSTDFDGGAVYIQSGVFRSANCTYFNNVANGPSSTGGAVALFDNFDQSDFTHNTFKDNNSTTDGTCISLINPGGNVFVTGNAGAVNGPNGTNQFGGSNFVSNGGNVIAPNNGTSEAMPWGLNAGDYSFTVQPFLHSSIVVDGYGLKYFTIVDSNSSYCDAVPNSGMTVPAKDARRAPRKLSGYTPIGVDVSPLGDAGACEYTLLRVTNPSGNILSIGSLPWAISRNYNLENYIEFDLPSGFEINPDQAIIETGLPTYVDGFSLTGTKIPGPKTYLGAGLNGGKIEVNLVDTQNQSIGIEFNGAPGSVLSGVRITDFNEVGVSLTAANTAVIGCQIGIDESQFSKPNLTAGIRIETTTDCRIGGPFNFQRNVVSGNGVGGALDSINIEIKGTSNIVQGNIIGLDTSGFSNIGSNQPGSGGIRNSGISNLIGGTGPISGNTISGNPAFGILEEFSASSVIINNKIGTDFEGNSAQPNQTGIRLVSSNSCVIGGTQDDRTRNIISSNSFTNVHFINSTDIFVEGNYIGLESTGTANLNISQFGVLIEGAASASINIGNGSPDGRNIISGNDKGVAVVSSGGDVNILDNYIGTDQNGGSQVSNNIGVYVALNASGCQIGKADDGNLISGNSLAGVLLDSASSQYVQGNIIGLNIAGNSSLGNGAGVVVEGGVNNTIGGDSLVGDGNIISGNSGNGIVVTDFASTTSIFGNWVGLESDGINTKSNGLNGIKIEEVSNTQIGASGSYANIISGHSGTGKTGVFCEFNGLNTVFENNYIGTDLSGTQPLGNETGLRITNDHEVKFGTGAAGTENYVCASVGNGVHILSPNVDMDGYSIGIGVSDANIGMGNALNGVLVEAPHVQIGLTTTPINSICNNGQNGILINGDNADSVEVGFTNLGLTAAGTVYGNLVAGIQIIDGDFNTIGSGKNVIIASPVGILISGTSIDNHVLNNEIGNLTGNSATSNLVGIQINGPSGQNELGDVSTAKGNFIGGNTSSGIYLNASDDNLIRANYIGIGSSNAVYGNGIGILMENSNGNIIGKDVLGIGTRNYISNSNNQGVLIDQNSNDNIITSNLIGVNVTGNGPASNKIGIEVRSGSEFNQIGGDVTLNLGNTISTNDDFGILINQADSNDVQGNIIGLTSANITGMGSQNVGIAVVQGAKGNAIGGERYLKVNHIAGNDSTGILISNSDGNLIGGNVIGADGSASPVQLFGIVLEGSGTNNNLIGTAPKSIFGNIIYQNTMAGIKIANAANNNSISSNIIGLDSLNSFSGNIQQPIGIDISPTAGYSPVGVSVSGAENVISANMIGILIDANSGQDIVNNFIGTDTTGLFPRGNTSAGIEISNGAANNIVGGINPFHSNLISGNDYGVRIEDNLTNNNSVINNVIGLNILQTDSIPNNYGVGINFGPQNNIVGGSTLGEGNLISGNYFGVAIGAANTNFVRGNKIGKINSNVYGMILLGGSTGNVIGGTSYSERNIISNNDSIGIGFQNAPSNTVIGNFIGLNETGTTAEPNILGMYFDNSTGNQIGGATIGEQNVISGNSLAGVILENNSNSNVFENNFIGTDSTGNNSLAGFGNEVGMFIIDSDLNQVGGDWQANEGNVFAGNLIDGIYLSGAETNTIEGNNIGLSKDNNVYLPNGNDGIKVFDGSNGNFIGTAGIGFENIITASGNNGITVKFSSGNTIENNYIGNDELGGQGTVSNPGTNNQINGIKLDTGSVGNFIIGKNIICGNSQSQILISGLGTNGNVVKSNHIGVDYDGNVAYSSGLTGVYINNGASNNVIGGASTLDKNIIGGNLQEYVKIMGPNCDSNQVAGNNIGLGLDDLTMYSAAISGVAIFGNCQYNVIGGGLPNQGNTIAGINGYGILIQNGNNNRVFGNELGILPGGAAGTIDSAGVRLENADFNYIGGLLVGSDSANTITNCDSGVDIAYWFGFSSYGNPIIGNSIYNNTKLGIDIDGDDAVLPNDTSNTNLQNNGEIDAPEIIEAWNCGTGGTTHIAFKFFSNNGTGTYRFDLYENSVPDANGYGEGEIFIGSYPFMPSADYDTINIDLGVTLAPGTIIAATMTGTLLNTSEFSFNDTVIVAPTFNVASIEDESCFGANNGYIIVTDAKPLSSSIDGGITNIYGPDTIFATTGTHTVEATYINGCVLSETVTINAGPALPFTYSFAEDTCGLGVGTILIDTTSTNAGGGSNNYSYSFSNGAAYNGPIDTLNITSGTYSIGLYDNSLGCFSQIETFTVGEITDVADESFTFADFCPNDTPLPVITGDTGGTWTCSNGSIDSNTGEILSPTPGNTYTVTYTVGVCNEFLTVDVTASDFDDSTFTYDDFCEGTVPDLPVATTPGGTWALVSGTGTIDANTGILTAAQGNYNVQYTTSGTCPTSMTQLVTVFDQPAAPQIITADSIYCPDEVYAEMSSSVAGDSYSWYDSSDHSNVLASTSTFTPVSLTIGNNYYYLTITNAAGCESKHDSINYISADVSVMQADPDIETCLSSTVTLGASGGTEYLWNSDMQIISDLDVSNPSATIGFDTEFIVRITDVFNCSVMDTLKVTLLPADSCFVEVYNAFSPNNDGTNDFWIIDGIEGFEENHVYVYNRWGDVIMDFVNYDNSSVVWNGDNRSNKPLPAGTYFYVVEVGGSQNSAGWVQLVK